MRGIGLLSGAENDAFVYILLRFYGVPGRNVALTLGGGSWEVVLIISSPPYCPCYLSANSRCSKLQLVSSISGLLPDSATSSIYVAILIGVGTVFKGPCTSNQDPIS